MVAQWCGHQEVFLWRPLSPTCATCVSLDHPDINRVLRGDPRPRVRPYAATFPGFQLALSLCQPFLLGEGLDVMDGIGDIWNIMPMWAQTVQEWQMLWSRCCREFIKTCGGHIHNWGSSRLIRRIFHWSLGSNSPILLSKIFWIIDDSSDILFQQFHSTTYCQDISFINV